MLKFTFEGANLNEVKESITAFINDLNSGTGVLEATGNSVKATKKEAKPEKKKITLDDIQDLLVQKQSSQADKDAKKAMSASVKGLLADFGVASSKDLEEGDFEDFYAKAQAL